VKVRQEVFDTYWSFAASRQQIFFSRLRNLPSPWTDDQILNTFKFCNSYRSSDRVSQFLIKDVIYTGSQESDEVIFRILLFKLFNKIETWQYLNRIIGEICLSTFDFDIYSSLLQKSMDAGQPIYTNAYMSCANKAYGYEKKHQNHLALIQQMVFKDKIADKILHAKSLEQVFSILVQYPLIGNFMAYQLAIDINYSEVINYNENDFSIAGPGAERGIKKCFTDTEGKSNTYIIQWMTENQEQEFHRLGIRFQSLWGRALHAIDCQGLFCETDKYCRAAFPDLKSNRKRIKAKFEPNPVQIKYFYPPKWKINERVQADLKTNEVKFSLLEPSSIQLPLFPK